MLIPLAAPYSFARSSIRPVEVVHQTSSVAWPGFAAAWAGAACVDAATGFGASLGLAGAVAWAWAAGAAGAAVGFAASAAGFVASAGFGGSAGLVAGTDCWQ